MTTTISNSYLTAKINHFGAELFSLKNKNNKEYIWDGNPEFWGKHSPILFPIVGTLKNNSYLYNDTEYHLSRHGFARDMEFELVRKEPNYVTFSLHSNLETLKIYPFEFELQITYVLEENTLNIQYKIINKSKSKMPFSIGAHPAFALTSKFENYSLQFEKEEPLKYYLLENDLLTNKTHKIDLQDKKVALDYQLFENDALIFKSLQSKTITIFDNSMPLLKVNFKDFPDLGIWTKKEAPFICIEPWFGYSDTGANSGNILEKEGIQILEKNNTFESVFSIEII